MVRYPFITLDTYQDLNLYSFIADEEIGGHDGMKMFVHSQEFKKMNIGLALDEGLASPTDEVPVYYGERNVYWVKFKIAGEMASFKT